MATPGAPSPTTTPARAPTAGGRTACWGCAIASAACVFPWRCGTAWTRSSRSDPSGWQTARATTAKTSRTTSSTSPTPPPTALCGVSTNTRSSASPTSSCWLRTGPAAASRPSSSWWRPASSPRGAISMSLWRWPRPPRMTWPSACGRSTAAPIRPLCTCCPPSGCAIPGRGAIPTNTKRRWPWRAMGWWPSRGVIWAATTCTAVRAAPGGSPTTKRTSSDCSASPMAGPFRKMASTAT